MSEDAPLQASEPEQALEARAHHLLQQPLAWPLAKRVGKRNGRYRKRFALYDYLFRKDHLSVFAAHDFQPDRISAWVVERSQFKETYARPRRDMRDSELDDKTTDALENPMPQFNLRNIGRYEMHVDVEGGLHWDKLRGIGGEIDNADLDEIRRAKLPEVEPVQIWSANYVARLRAQLRRLVLEDPWDMKYGPEATSTHNGNTRGFIVEGTHPDDQPGADFSPKLIPRPKEWAAAPKGDGATEQPYDIVSDALRYAQTPGKFEL